MLIADQTQFKTDGFPAFPVEDKENDNSSTSSTDKTNGDQTQSHGGDQTQADKKDGVVEKGPLHEDPRWKEREEDWKNRFNSQEQRHTSELQKLREDFDKKFEKPQGQTTSSDIPAWFGGDEHQWADYVKHQETLVTQAEERALKRITEAKEGEQKKVQEATAYFQQEVVAIEADKTLNPQGEKVDRNKLLKTALDFDLVDSQGRWNYKAAYAFMKNHQSSGNNTQDRKNLANATTSDRRAESKQQPFTTSADFQKPANRPW